MSVTLINPVDGSVFASFGAHPSFEVALERRNTFLYIFVGEESMEKLRARCFLTEELFP